MKSTSFLLLLAGSTFFLSSCKNSEEAPAETPAVPTEVSVPDAAAETTTPETPATTAAAGSKGEAPKLNPAHGQPFHRCDIAVGAPLDGSGPAPAPAPAPAAPTPAEAPKSFFKTVQSTQPAPAPAPTLNATPASTPQPKPATTATADANTPKPKNNPAHGQPHHRCDIKVGDPLPDE
jgi:hypothetical protein